ncbi:MAG: 5-formyltetrahydrofolate cyclo-ligase [Pseudomonadota bacterium]
MSAPSKQSLRTQLRRRRRELDARAQKQRGESFKQRVLRTPEYQRAGAIAGYMPVHGELDIRPLLRSAIENGRAVYLPVIDGASMWFARWNGRTPPIDRTSNLPQPLKRDTRLLNARQLDLVFVPLVGFTAQGARLGQGGGYYDRMFAVQKGARWRRPTLIGAAHDLQQVAHIPTDPWDVPLPCIITNQFTFRQ